MKKTILNILICVVLLFLIFFVSYFFNGSLEMYPTEEQQEKVRLITGLLSILLAIIEMVLVLLRFRIAKQSKK